jgi:hypothetical protein
VTNPRTERRRGGSESQSVSSQLDWTQGTADVSPSDVHTQLHRRRVASWQCPPLLDGYQDPWHYRATEPVSERELASWRTAWSHLHALGLPAVVPERVLAAAGSMVA